jgi:hypothetical protein
VSAVARFDSNSRAGDAGAGAIVLSLTCRRSGGAACAQLRTCAGRPYASRAARALGEKERAYAALPASGVRLRPTCMRLRVVTPKLRPDSLRQTVTGGA